MSTFAYNGIAPSYIKTNAIERTPRYSDDGSEYMWTDFTIDLNCLISPSATSYPDAGDLPAETDVAIRSILLQPRRPLFFSEGGVAIINLTATQEDGSTIDCANGPMPQVYTIYRIASTKLFFARIVVRTSIIECPVGSFISAIASSRYGRSESIDRQYRSTITTTGKAYFRSNVLQALGLSADNFRGYIIPQPLGGYKRELVQVGLDSSGLMMEFTTVDREQFIDLGGGLIPGTAGGAGIVEMGLKYSTSAIGAGELGITGIKGILATVRAWAIGTKTASTFDMLQFLVKCAADKFGQLLNSGMPTGMEVEEDPFEQSVSLSLTLTVQPPNGQPQPVPLGLVGVVGAPIASLPSTNGVEPAPPFGNSTRGMTSYLIAVNALATACYTEITAVGGCDASGQTPSDTFIDGGACPATPQVVVYQPVEWEPGEDNRVKGKISARGPNPDQGAYLSYNIRDDYKNKTGNVQAPIAAPAEPPGQPSLGGSQPADVTTTGDGTDNGPQPTSVVLQIYQPITERVVSFSIERIGCIPEVPDPTPTLDGYQLLTHTVTPVGIDLGPDGQSYIYRVSGCYTYALTIPKQEGDPLPFSIPPWVEIEAGEDTTIQTEDFAPGIIDNDPGTAEVA